MKNKSVIIYALSVLMLAGCAGADRKPLDVAEKITAIPIQTEPDGRWGMMSTSGELMFENEFVDEPTAAVNGCFAAKENGTMSVYVVADQPRLLGKCEGLSQVGVLNAGLMPVAKAEKISVVDDKGAEVFALGPINNKAVIGSSAIFSNGRLVVADAEGLYGCVDIEGNVVIAPKYAHLNDYSSGYVVATLTDGLDAVLDYDGKTVITVRQGLKAVSEKVKCDHIIVSDSVGHLSFAGLDGVYTRLPEKVRAVGDYNEKVFTFRDANDLWGLMNRNDDMEMVMRPKFREINILDDNENFLVNLDGAWSVINIKGKRVITFPSEYTQVVAADFNSPIKYFARDMAGWVLLNAHGAEISLPFNIYGLGYSTADKWLSVSEPTPTVAAPVSIADDIAAQISPNTLCGIQLNAIGNRWYRNQVPDSLVDTKEFVPDSIPDLKHLGNVNVLGVTDKLISVAMRVNAQTGKIEYAFMPSNTVAAIELDIPAATPELFTKSKADLLQKLQEMGFKIIDDTDDLVLMRSAYANLEISYDDDEKTITVLMYRL